MESGRAAGGGVRFAYYNLASDSDSEPAGAVPTGLAPARLASCRSTAGAVRRRTEP
jgi:hypothetical protein